MDPSRPPVAPWWVHLAPVAAFVGGVVAYVALLIVLLMTRNPNLFPALLLVGALTVPLAVLLFAITDRDGPLAPAGIVLTTVLAGGVVGILGASLFEAAAAAAFGRASILLVGVIEESCKLIVPLIVLLVAYRRTRAGGVAIGVAAGAGFAVLETMGYGFQALLARGGGLGALDTTLVLRGVLAPAGHVAWTGAVCAAIWYLRSGKNLLLGVIATLVAYVGAILLHTLWDASPSNGVHLVVGVLSAGALLVLIVLAHRAHGREVDVASPVGPPRTRA